MPFESIPGAIGPDHWFPQAWALALSEVVEALDLGGGAGPVEVRVSAADPATWLEWSEPLWHAQSWAPGENAQIWLGCPASVPLALWVHIGGGDGADGAVQALETFREMLNQSGSGAAAEVTSRLGQTAQAAAARESARPDSGWAVELRFRAAGADHTLALAGNAAMAQTLNPPEVKPPAAEPRRKTTAASRPAEASSDPIDLIRDVEMELAVSFGDTTMALADVLKLASGAIIELNRSVSDPVEVLVNDSVIARGDVVVVDGNYGVRITEIVSRRDRVRSMM